MNFLKTSVLVAAILLLTGCQNMMHKYLGMGGSTEGVNVVLGTDPQSGNPIPIPQKIALGWGAFFWLDMPVTDDGECWYYNETVNFWTGKASSKTFIYMRSGDGTIKGHVKVELEDSKIIDLPIFKVYNPLSNDKEVKLDGKALK